MDDTIIGMKIVALFPLMSPVVGVRFDCIVQKLLLNEMGGSQLSASNNGTLLQHHQQGH